MTRIFSMAQWRRSLVARLSLSGAVTESQAGAGPGHGRGLQVGGAACLAPAEPTEGGPPGPLPRMIAPAARPTFESLQLLTTVQPLPSCGARWFRGHRDCRGRPAAGPGRSLDGHDPSPPDSESDHHDGRREPRRLTDSDAGSPVIIMMIEAAVTVTVARRDGRRAGPAWQPERTLRLAA
jgi:hypothetical protein